MKCGDRARVTHTRPGQPRWTVRSHYGEMPLAASDGVQTAARKCRLNAAGGACAVRNVRGRTAVSSRRVLGDGPGRVPNWLTRTGFAVRAHAPLPASHSRPARILGPTRRSAAPFRRLARAGRSRPLRRADRAALVERRKAMRS